MPSNRRHHQHQATARRHRLRESALRPVRASYSVRVSGQPLDSEGYRWPVTILAVGPSLNTGSTGLPIYYTEAAVSQAAPVFEGARIFLDHQTDLEARERPERSMRDLAGRVRAVRYDPEQRALVGEAVLVDEAFARKVMLAAKLGELDMIGLSISAAGQMSRQTIEGRQYDAVSAIVAGDMPATVDAVTYPAAGGGIITRIAASLRAARKGGSMTFAELLAARPKLGSVFAALDEAGARNLIEGLTPDGEDPEALIAGYTAWLAESKTKAPVDEAMVTCPMCEGTGECEACSGTGKITESAARTVRRIAAARRPSRETTTADPLVEALRAERVRELVRLKLDGSGLPEPAREHLRPLLEAMTAPAQMDAAIAAQRTLVAKLTEAVPKFPAAAPVQAGPDAHDRYCAAIDGFIARKSIKMENGETVDRFRNFRDVVENFPGRKATGALAPSQLMEAARSHFWGSHRGGAVRRNGQSVPLREAISTTTHAEIFADRVHKRLEMLWHSSNDVSEVTAWASLQDTLTDTKTHRYIHLGEYGDPSTVAEGATYPTIASPGDTEETYALTKIGFLDSVTLEALLDPDGAKLSALPDRMSQAMRRYLRQVAIDGWTRDNPTLNSDSVALYHAGTHVNLLTTALSIGQLNTIRFAMRQQAARGSSAQVGPANEPWGIVVPPELVGRIERITNPSPQYVTAIADTDASVLTDPLQWKGKLKILVADHFTNAGDYYISADPSKMSTWVWATMQGVPTPEFFVADDESSGGSPAFTADTVTWKYRFWYASEPLDYIGLHWSDV